ncbi:ephrin type-A receptor 8-like [Dysidea avara]|uniref:ephrin type-A receptor 8-like n=1 Tax=Dysidea avara TaxID=196820 RepID=UPI00331BF44C
MVEQFLHENIVRLYGVVLQGKMMMILEYLSQGNLLNHLQSIRPREGEPVGQHIPQMLLGFARDVGRGMNYLSNKCFIHRDLAARNILLTENNVCKIADFGLARDLDEENYYISQGGRIPVRWMPPEAVLYRTYTTASDVWSYGILLYEMWSLGHKPYEDHDNTEVLSLISNGYRLPPPPGCPRALYHTMIQCWHPDYHQRPNFSALLCAISQPSYVLFHWFEEDKQAAGPECDVIGAPIEAGCNLYIDLQNFFK